MDAAPFPDDLRSEIRRAAQLSHTLSRLARQTPAADPSFVWLVGRADEVRAFVGTAMREWQEGRVPRSQARERIASYVRELEETVGAFFPPDRPRAPYAFRPPHDTILDA
jgi:hypothetical protein